MGKGVKTLDDIVKSNNSEDPGLLSLNLSAEGLGKLEKLVREGLLKYGQQYSIFDKIVVYLIESFPKKGKDSIGCTYQYYRPVSEEEALRVLLEKGKISERQYEKLLKDSEKRKKILDKVPITYFANFVNNKIKELENFARKYGVNLEIQVIEFNKSLIEKMLNSLGDLHVIFYFLMPDGGITSIQVKGSKDECGRNKVLKMYDRAIAITTNVAGYVLACVLSASGVGYIGVPAHEKIRESYMRSLEWIVNSDKNLVLEPLVY